MALGCCCNCRVTLPEVDVWENVTKVVAWPGNADQTPIDPYGRAWGVLQDGSCILAGDEPNATCGRNDGTQGVCYTQSFDGTTLGGNWLATPDGILPGSGAPGETINTIYDNTYRNTGAKTNFSHACVGGWKGVAAYAHWPGRFGFLQDPTCGCPDNQQQFKYSTINARVHVRSAESVERLVGASNPCGDPVGAGGVYSIEWAMTADQMAQVDGFGNVTRSGTRRYYGRRTNNGYDLENGTYDPECGYPLVVAADYEDIYDGCDDCLIATESGCSASRCDRPPGNEFLGSSPSFSGAFNLYSMIWLNLSISCGNITFGNVSCGSYFSGNAGELQSYLEGLFPPGSVAVSVSLSDTLLAISLSGSGDSASNEFETITASVEASMSWELSGEITFASVMADCISLLDQWPLHDDAAYPWRTDSKTWLMPYVTRDAAPTEPSIDWTLDENCAFISSTPYSGKIIGAPLPAGYSGHFDFNHIKWTRGANDSNTGCSVCESELGAEQSAPVPNTATRWTDYSEGASMCGPGAHVQQRIDYAYADGAESINVPGVRMQKWAETLEKWPSTNFFRPFGDDRWRMDMGNSSCIDAVDTGTKTLTLLDGITVSAGDLVVIYGGADYPDQIWSVSSYSHPSLVLGTQFDPTPAGTVETLVAASREEWAEAGQWGEFGKVGKLRWQYSRDGAQWPWPRVTGRDLAITVDTVDTYKITLPENNIVSGDKVTVWNGGSQVGGTLYFKRITDTTGELYTDAAFTTTQDATGATLLRGYEASPPEQSWNTDASRNTVVLSQFDSQFREADADPMVPSYAETHSQLALSRSNSRQCVFCASPNSQDTDYFSGNGSGSVVVTWDAGRISADMCFGEAWHARITQHMPDPLWQSPSQTCDAAISQESAPCAGGESTYKYYPIVEPLLASALPAGSPTIPGSPNWLDTGSAPSAVGIDGISAGCPVEPRQRGTIHAVREAWESCQNQKDQRNSGL